VLRELESPNITSAPSQEVEKKYKVHKGGVGDREIWFLDKYIDPWDPAKSAG
jgi:hypothetical protein